MKYIRNTFRQQEFDTLQEAKTFFDGNLNIESIMEDFDEEYAGISKEEYKKKLEEYKEEINGCESFEELVRILNSNTDYFEDGSEWEVREI